MSLDVNTDTILWGLSLIQPCSAEDIQKLLGHLYPDAGPIPNIKNIQLSVDHLVNCGFVVQVHVKAGLYSMTERGHQHIPKRQRHIRDKLRLFLLKSAHNARVSKSEEVAQGLPGDSPGEDDSSGIKEVARPVDSVVIPRTRKGSLARNYDRVYWPRLLKQLNSPVGLTATSSDTLLSYYSFHTVAAINDALNNRGLRRDIQTSGLALAIGISPRLLGYLMQKPERNYRRFEIGKRGGGTRTIDSPRVFLKTIQAWINDYILWRLPVHPNCHAYVRGKSIVTNALGHTGKAYVGCIDIEDFFGSLSDRRIRRVLVEQGIGENLAYSVSKLATLRGGLPQGAPSSPTLSNAALYSFDHALAKECEARNLSYSRYADDIAISGNRKDQIGAVIGIAESLLSQSGLRLNKSKTRIASRGGQQRIAGVVVNSFAQPPRILRRRIRAMFHQATVSPEDYKDRVDILRGYLSYLNSFPHLRETNQIKEYREIIKKVDEPVNFSV